MKHITDEKQIEQELAGITLSPGNHLDSRLKNAPWTDRAVTRRRTTASVLVLSFMLVFLAALTPRGMALAQNILHYFLPATSETHTVNTIEMKSSVTPAAETSQISDPSVVVNEVQLAFEDQCGSLLQPICSVETIRSMVNYPVSGLSELPGSWRLIGATGSPDMVYVLYRSIAGELVLSQSPVETELPAPWIIGQNAQVENVQVGNSTAEYVQGSWVDTDKNIGALKWDTSTPQRILRWENDGLLYTLRFLPAKSEEGIDLDKATLVSLASQLTERSPFAVFPKPTPKQDIETTQAEAGFVVSKPGWVPERYALINSAAVSGQKSVCLYYAHPGSETFGNMVIIQSSRTLSLEDIKLAPQFYGSIQLDIPINLQNVPVGGADNNTALYASNGLDINTLCGTQTLTSNHALLWHNGGFSFVISGMLDAFDGRSFITLLEMQKVAESLTGVQKIPFEQADPAFLQSAADVQVLSGFTVKRPGQIPDYLSFAYASYRDAKTPAGPVSMGGIGEEIALVYFARTSDSIERRHSLLIFQGTAEVNKLEEAALRGGEWVTVNNLPAVYSQQCWEEIAGSGTSTCGAMLTWFDADGIRYEIDTYLPGFIEKTTLLEIAESMQ